MTRTPHPLRGAMLSLVAFCAYACSDVSIKALGQGLNSFQVMFVAGICTIPFVVAQIFWMDRRASLRPALPRMTAARVVVTLIGSACTTYTFTHLPLAQCYAIFFSMPLIITVLAWPLLGEPIDPLRGLIVVCGFAGVLIALQPGSTDFQLAHLTAAAGAVTGALNSLMLRKIGHRERAGVILLYPLVAQAIGAACVLPFVWAAMSLGDVGIGVQTGFLGAAGGFFIISAYRTAPAIVVAPMQYSQILWASILGLIFFRESPSAATSLGIAVIITAGISLLVVAGRSVALKSAT